MNTLIIGIFVFGYLCIAFEHTIKINKAASALLTGVFCWVVYILNAGDHLVVNSQLLEHVGNFSGILFFLMGAMTIVELIDAHDGFSIITSRIGVKSKRQLLWLIGLITFFLSAVLDNLTTTIVMISVLTKFSLNKEERMLLIGIVVIAANAGGAWSPIGDVTTTMLWIGGQISSAQIIKHLFLPSLLCAIVPVALVSLRMRGELEQHLHSGAQDQNEAKVFGVTVLLFGIMSLLFVPVFKTATHLPPFMGMLLALGVLWLVTELLHAKKDEMARNHFSVSRALSNIDMPSVLFFLGILISIAALESVGTLHRLSLWLDKTIGNATLIDMAIGLLSAIVDNVPLVAGAMGIYSLQQYPIDHHFWIFLSYCAGTGGSALIIGSAAGVAAMGIAKIDFLWYLRKITPLALAGYAAGAGVYLLQRLLW